MLQISPFSSTNTLLHVIQFRGLSYGTDIQYQVKGESEGRMDKLPHYCTEEAVAIQRATAKAQLEYMIKPLEAQGFKVDVYISTYGCTDVAHLTKAKQEELHRELLKMYGDNVVASKFIKRKRGLEVTQDTGLEQAMLLLLESAPLNYESIIVWRYDCPPLGPMGPPTLDVKGSLDSWYGGRGGDIGWRNYGVLGSSQVLFWYCQC